MTSKIISQFKVKVLRCKLASIDWFQIRTDSISSLRDAMGSQISIPTSFNGLGVSTLTSVMETIDECTSIQKTANNSGHNIHIQVCQELPLVKEV